MDNANSRSERSVGDLISDLTDQSSQLMRKEAELIKSEMSDKVSQVKSALVMLALGAAGLIVGLFYLLDALMFGISEILPADLSPWLAALIIGAIAAAAGYAAIKKGEQQLSPDNLTPERTVRSLNKDKEMVKEHVQ